MRHTRPFQALGRGNSAYAAGDRAAAAEKALAIGGPWRAAALDTLASIERAEKKP